MSRQRTIEKNNGIRICINRRIGTTDQYQIQYLKFYTEEGMLPFEQAETNLTRRFKRVEAITRIEEIREMRQNGKTIPQIKELLQESVKDQE